MTMQEYIKNEDGPIPVTSVRQLIYLGNRHNSFISDTLFGKIDEILKRYRFDQNDSIGAPEEIA